MRMTPRLSRWRANSVWGSQAHCPSDVCLGHELVRNDRGHTATLSVVLPAVTVETVASFRTSSILPFGRCCIQVSHETDDFRFLRVSFRSNFGIGVIEFVQVKRHQDGVTHDVTIIHVPKVRQTSLLLQGMS